MFHIDLQAVRNILQQCYANPNAVTDELVDVILKPGLQPGAADVFLDFISYSGGPTPEALMRDVQVPVSVVWGAEDPWEKVEWGRAFKVRMCEQQERCPVVGAMLFEREMIFLCDSCSIVIYTMLYNDPFHALQLSVSCRTMILLCNALHHALQSFTLYPATTPCCLCAACDVFPAGVCVS